MSGAREIDVDELFDRNADTRLLDRRRGEELGLPPIAPTASSTPARFGPESMVGDGVPLAAPRGPMLRVSAQARPERELIPGAVVTVVAEVADEGDTDADDVTVRIAIPPESEAIPGSFARDGVELDGEALLGEGLRIGTVPAAGFVRIRFALRVLPGTEPLDVAAHAGAPGVPAIAAPTLRLTRRSGHTAYDAPRPFFELETDEHDDDLATAAAQPETAHAVDTVLDEPAAPVLLEPVSQPEPEPEIAPEPKDEEPEPEPRPALAPERAPAAKPKRASAPRAAATTKPAAAYVFARVLDADEIRALDRVFSGSVPHGLAALALLSSVAAVESPLGRALGVSAFARAVGAALPRALVAARMGRPTPAVVTPDALGAIRARARAPAKDVPYEGPLMVARIDARELSSLRTLLARDLADPFLRGVQVLLAVAPRALEGVADDVAASAGDALAAYRTAAGAWLMRVTVRRAVDRRYDPLTAEDASLHEAGRALVAVLREAVG